jgi:uncharacterized protein
VPLSVYDVTVPAMTHGLNVLRDYLGHAQSLEHTRGLRPGTLLGARLAPDMLTFGEQASVSCNKVEAHMAKLCQRDKPVPKTPPMTYPGLTARLGETSAFLRSLEPDDMSEAQSHTYELMPPIVRGWFGGDDYIRHLVMPDFFFHIAVAHAILRHLGAPVGKKDYLGNLTGQSGGYS